jgi:hypothetical protein
MREGLEQQEKRLPFAIFGEKPALHVHISGNFSRSGGSKML